MGKIIIFSIGVDMSTSTVIRWLNKMGEEVIRINGDEDRFRLKFIDDTGVYFTDLLGNEIVNLCEAKSCWYRRNAFSRNTIQYKHSNVAGKDLFNDKDKNPDILKKHLDQEYEALIQYIYRRTENAAPITLGSYFTRKLNRLEVLDTARTYGLKVPSFYITTAESQVYSLCQTMELVSKAISDGIYEVVNQKRYYTYTEKINPQELFPNDEIPIYPSLLMPEIKKDFEIRAFYLNGHFYSMAIFSQNNKQTEVDFRKYSQDLPNRMEPFELPADISGKLQQLFIHYNLNTGSADIIVDKKGDYYFLEINPVGQFGMVSEPCNYSLELKIAQYLKYGTSSGTQTNQGTNGVFAHLHAQNIL